MRGWVDLSGDGVRCQGMGWDVGGWVRYQSMGCDVRRSVRYQSMAWDIADLLTSAILRGGLRTWDTIESGEMGIELSVYGCTWLGVDLWYVLSLHWCHIWDIGERCHFQVIIPTFNVICPGQEIILSGCRLCHLRRTIVRARTHKPLKNLTGTVYVI